MGYRVGLCPTKRDHGFRYFVRSKPLNMKALLCGCLAALLACSADAQNYSNQANEQELAILNPTPYFGSGASLVDIDQDGWDDLTIVHENDSVKIWRNVDGLFEPIPSPAYIAGDAKQATWADYDNDGDLDLLVTVFIGQTRLYRNEGDWAFTDVTLTAGMPIDDVGRHFGASWCDYDKDGFLDVYLCSYNIDENGASNQLMHNNGDGTFSNLANLLGVDNGLLLAFQSVWMDYDNDNWPDLYVVNDKSYMPNALYRNNGDGTFTDVSEDSGANVGVDAMTCSVADVDHNGYLDVYMTNEPWGNVLLLNNGDGTFTDVAEEAGVLCNSLTWGALWFDHDHDMDDDLYVANIDASLNNFNFFFDNNGDATFTQSFIEGASDVAMISYGVSKGDWNNDGHWDFTVINAGSYPAALMRSVGSDAGWVKVDLTGTVSQWEAIGSWIRYVVGSEERHVYTLSGENFLGQDSKSELLSLGDATQLDTLEITWPSGLVETYTNVSAGTHLELSEGATLQAQILIDGEATGLCAGESVTLSVDLEGEVNWGAFGTGPTLTVDASGTYQATVTHPLGFVVQTAPLTIEVAEPLAVDDLVVGISCYGQVGGIALLPVDPEAVASISWNDGAYSELTLNNIPAGDYTYTLVDTNGCTQSGSYTLTEPEELLLDANATDVTCFGEANGAVTLDILGGTPDYTISGDAGLDGLSGGTYAYTVTDAANCVTSIEVEVLEPEALAVSSSTVGTVEGEGAGEATVDVTGGTPPYSYLWSNGNTESSSTGLEPGVYSVWVIDGNGCTWFESLVVDALVGIPGMDPNTYTPYPNPLQETLYLDHLDPIRYRVTDADGSEVERGTWLPRTGLDTRNWAAGAYVLYLYDTPAGTLTRLLVRP